jgi:hypothetical protein
MIAHNTPTIKLAAKARVMKASCRGSRMKDINVSKSMLATCSIKQHRRSVREIR